MQKSSSEPTGSIPRRETVPGRELPASLVLAILEKLEDPNYFASEVLPLISAGIGKLGLVSAVHQTNPQSVTILSSIRAQL